MYIRNLHKDGSVPNQNQVRAWFWQDLYMTDLAGCLWSSANPMSITEVIRFVDTACCYGNRLTALVQSQVHKFVGNLLLHSQYANCSHPKRLKYAATQFDLHDDKALKI